MTIEKRIAELEHDLAVAKGDAQRALALEDWERLGCLALDLVCIEERLDELQLAENCGLLRESSSKMDKPTPERPLF